MNRGRARQALLLIDFINPLDPPPSPTIARDGAKAAKRTAALRSRLARRRVPVIYVNDHFGNWQRDFGSLYASCLDPACAGRAMAQALAPLREDYVVLKPRHSGFFGSPLEFLLAELEVDRLIVTGIATDVCVLFTAHDAYMRRFALWVPSDCVAAPTPARGRWALRHMNRVLRADTRSSTA